MNTYHLRNFSQLFHQEGTARDERFLPALDPGKMALDDRKLTDLLLYMQRLSGYLSFNPGIGHPGHGEGGHSGPVEGGRPGHAEGGRPGHAEGGNPAAAVTWRDHLQNDIVFLLADVSDCSIAEIRRGYRLLEGEFDQDREAGRFWRLLDTVYTIFEKLDRWYERAVAESADGQLRRDLQLYIQSYLGSKLSELNEIRRHAGMMVSEEEQESTPVHVFHNTDRVWGDPDAVDRAFRERVFAGEDDEEKLLNASIRLKEIFDTVVHVTEQVVNRSQVYLSEVLHDKKDHQPHIGLMIAFLELYGFAREEINKLPRKHLDFYYGTVLAIKRRPAVPDCVYLYFELARGFSPHELKKGTLLSAGKDRINKELAYATNRDLVVNPSKVAALRTLLIGKDAQGHVVRYYSNGVDQAADGGAGDDAAGATLALFGDDKGNIGRIGFAIASAQLYLTKGERNVVVRFELDKDLTAPGKGGSWMELRLTGEKGWLSSKRADDGVRINSIARVEEKVLELNFTVSIAQASAIVAYNPKLHEGGYGVDLPMMEVLLTGDANGLAPWEPVLSMRPRNTVITVQVGSLDAMSSFDGVRDLALYNHEGPLDAKKPFMPFTAVPKVGSSFYIGCDDLYYKPIQRLTVNLEWMLPDRFSTYYDKYMPPYDSNRFRASLSLLQKKRWRKVMETSIIDRDAKDPRWRQIRMDLTAPVKPEEEGSVSRYDPEKMDGTLKLKLQYPDFGHGTYSQLVTAAVMERAAGPKMPDFYKKIREELPNADSSIDIPHNVGDRNGPFKVVIYDLLASSDPDERVRSLMIRGISGIIRVYQQSQGGKIPSPEGTRAGQGQGPGQGFAGQGSGMGGQGSGSAGPGQGQGGAGQASAGSDPEDQRSLINEDKLNFWERSIKRVFPNLFSDREKETLGEEAEQIEKKILPKADFILPSRRELAIIINSITESAIEEVVIKITDEIIAERHKGLSGDDVARIFTREFAEANKVINEMVARKIAAMLMTGEMPPPPYTPVINMISVNYVSSRSLNEKEDRFFRVTPFGYAAIRDGQAFFDEASIRNPGGLLYIGVAGAEPGQELSLLFHLREGTGNTDKTPPPVEWSYLTDNEWKALPADCQAADSTYGLQATGVWQLTLPMDANDHNTLLDVPGLYWLCASVDGETDAFPRLTAIYPNAVTACFVDRGNDPSHAATPLLPGKISKLADKIPAIKKVTQALASFGGRVAEQDTEYYTRVSERLRHKARAIDAWDYEHLVLENFPAVFKIKCLSDYWNGRAVRGHVTVVPICNLQNRADTMESRLSPRATFALLRQIERFLAERTSPFVQVHAINPQLSHIVIRGRVKFKKGVDKGYALQKLEKGITDLLTPWASDDSKLRFSAKIYASNVISFIGDQEEVDYIEGFGMRQYIVNDKGEREYCQSADGERELVETQFINGHTLLVSAPAHEVVLVD
jgi:hypothetical protein